MTDGATDDTGAGPTGPTAPEATGRYLVLLDAADRDGALGMLGEITGDDVTSSTQVAGRMPAERLAAPGAVVFERLGVAVVTAPDAGVRELAAATRDGRPVLAVEPERYVYPAAAPAEPPPAAADPDLRQYLRGYRDGVDQLARSLGAGDDRPTPTAIDESQVTWGLQLTGAADAALSGAGVRVAVLDTGLDLEHPDFAQRALTAESFVDGEDVQDGHGHGTHCIGTACGPLDPAELPRYGIAHEAEIFAGKVLSNAGSGTDGQILAGIEWAIANGCGVVSMSLGAPTTPGQAFSTVFEQAAQRALDAGTLIVAAAGNDSDRDAGVLAPVAHPANCPSIMAVGAVDVDLQVAAFSNSSVTPGGGEVDVVGPGVAVRSAWPEPTRYMTISGTSMATPHAAGIAALWLQSRPQTTATELFGTLMRSARRLPLPATDVGAGLVHAP